MHLSATDSASQGMGKRFLRKNLAIGLILIVALASVAGIHALRRAKEKWRFAVAITNVHMIAGLMQSYVEYYNEFPPNLETLLKDSGNDQHMLDTYYGEIAYFPPGTNASGTSIVMVVTFQGKRILVNKDFERLVEGPSLKSGQL